MKVKTESGEVVEGRMHNAGPFLYFVANDGRVFHDVEVIRASE